MAPHLDKLDYKILATLQKDGKITNIQLSEIIGLSTASTLERVKKLELHGFIKSFHAHLDAHKLGLHIHVWLQICLHDLNRNNIKAFQKAIDELDEVVACYQVMGNADFLLQILTTDLSAYQNILINKLSIIPTIKSIKTMTTLSTIKESGIPMLY